MEKIDSLLNLNAYGSLCIIELELGYAQLLINRLCVHTMLPKKHGGVGEGYSKIISTDAGNCSDVYQIVDFGRQSGLEIKRALKNMIVSRVFTIYQLANLVINELPRIIQQLSSDEKKSVIVLVYGLLHLFVSDPHIYKTDAKQLRKEIAASIKKTSEDRFVVISLTDCKVKDAKTLLPIFDKEEYFLS